MPKPESLMNVATNSSLRIFERIRIIKGDDKKISSPEEAKAILAIPSSDVIWSDNKSELPLAKIDANSYLKYGDKNLLDAFAETGKRIIDKGNVVLGRLSDYLRNNYPVAQNTK